ncbi:MAG: glycosyltransferase family 39 protein [Vulcanimicrobiaceae bacterium]
MSRWFGIVVIAAIAFGCGLRVTTLGDKLFYLDETFTQIRVAGYTTDELQARLFDGRARSVPVVRRYLAASADRGSTAVVRSLAHEDAQHPPLFYVLDRLVVRLLGESVVAWRAFALICGLLAIGAAYWMGVELFGTRRAGALIAALAAMSPFCALYSQQAREYAPWLALTFAASAALVRARATGKLRWWAVYLVALLAGLYTALLFAFVLLAHAIFVASDRRIDRRSLIAFGAGAIVAIAGFLPWVAVVIRSLGAVAATNDWGSAPWSPLLLAAKLAFNVGTAFFDLEYAQPLTGIALLGIAALVFAAVRWIFTDAPGAAARLLVPLTAAPVVVLVGSDLVLRHHHFTEARYFVPTIAGLIVAVGGYLAHARTERIGRRNEIFATALLLAAAASLFVGMPATIWWTNHQAGNVVPIARALDAQAAPLIASTNLVEGFELCIRLRPAASIVFAERIVPALIERANRPVFLLTPDAPTLARLRADPVIRVEPVIATASDNAAVGGFRRLIGRPNAPAAARIDLNQPTLWFAANRSVFPNAALRTQ